MNILAFDTSSTACSVALQCSENIYCLHENAPKQQAKLILPMINELLNSAFLKFNQLDAIAYGCGPGSFTGIRIASSVAQGIGFATQLPIIQVSSMAAIAQAAFLEKKWAKLLVAIDARMEQIYWASYEANESGVVELIGQEKIGTPEEVAIPHHQDWYGVGDGWEKLKSRELQPKMVNSLQLPTAEAILTLAKVKLNKKDWIKPSFALPVYLR